MGIKNSIQKNLTKWPEYDLNLFANSELFEDPLDYIKEKYCDLIYKNLCFCKNDQKSSLRITYSAMHGVGHLPTLWAFKKFGLPLPIPVAEQVEGNGDFPTSQFPNPEEGEPVFRYSFKTADLHGSQLIICQDPDADRVGVAVKKDGKWKIFHGNHTGVLLTYWQIIHFQGDRSKSKFFNSTVSTQLQRVIAEKEGFLYEETLTGFKWLGNHALKAEQEGFKALLAFEEAIGFSLLPGLIPDKDAISCSVVIAEMAHFYHRTENKSLLDVLNDIYLKYGFFLFNNSYFINPNPQITDEIFERIRQNGKYIQKIGEYKIKDIRDMTLGYDTRTSDNKTILPKQSSQMITFYLENGCVATIRSSGTEPKIKWYIEIGADNEAQALSDLNSVVMAVESDLLQKEKYGFKRPDN